jgi:hypothetical protein
MTHHLIAYVGVVFAGIISLTGSSASAQDMGAASLKRVGPAPTALVYRGPGACDEGCSDAAALVASHAGLNPVFVGPSENDPSIFENAVIWIQPGGYSKTAADNMTDQLKGWLKSFVSQGGGYVGFCAGGFLATAHIGDLTDPGLGLIPGSSSLYRNSPTGASVLPIEWGGVTRQVYWEGGPAFYVSAQSGAQVTATYPDGTAASIRARYGSGRVYVTGLHPEAPQRWRNYYGLSDSDGLDYDLAVGMIRWARKGSRRE